MGNAVEILKDGLTAQGNVYMKGDIENKPQDVLISCAKTGKTVRFVKEQAEPEPTPVAGSAPEERKEKPKKRGFLARILRK